MHFARPPGLESKVFLRDRAEAKPFPSTHLALARRLLCVHLLLQWPAPPCLCLQQHLTAHDHTAEELGAASQMPSTLYVAFPASNTFLSCLLVHSCSKTQPSPTAPSSGELLFSPLQVSPAGQSVSLAGAEKECCEDGEGKQVGQRGEPVLGGSLGSSG